MKVVLVFPPLWDLNILPMLGVPVIAGCLRHFGHSTLALDLNSEFYNYVSTESFWKKVTEHYKELANSDNPDKQQYFKSLKSECSNPEQYIEKVKNYMQVFRTKELFFEASKLNNALSDVDKITYTAAKLNQVCFEYEETTGFNLFEDFYEQVFEKIKEFNPDAVGLSVYWEKQLDWSRHFTKFLKKKTDAKIFYGGPEITYSKEKILTKEFFETYADYAIYGDGEVSLKKLGDYFNGEIELNAVPSLVYYDNDVCITPPPDEGFKEMFSPCYEGFDFNSYFSYPKVISLETSRGCYWNKCAFCSCSNGVIKNNKSAQQVIEEIEGFQKQFGINEFSFIDPAVSPKFLDDFSKLVIDKGLKIKYSAFTRLEKAFTGELLEQLSKSGLKFCLWGLESGSQRILDLYNKGTSIENNKRVLKDAHKAGIFNFVSVIAGFPKETEDDIAKTLEFLNDNIENIDIIAANNFLLLKGAPIEKEPEKFGLTSNDFEFNGSMGLYIPENESIFDAAFDKISKLNQDKIKNLPMHLNCMASYVLR